MARGRKRIPLAQKILRDTYQPGRQETGAQLRAARCGVPSCPSYVKGEARKEWNRVMAVAEKAGIVTKLDRASLVAYCLAWGRLVEAQEHIEKEGMTLPNGRKSPWLLIHHQAEDAIRKFSGEFGFTPSSRMKVASTPLKAEDNEEDALLKLLEPHTGASA